MRLTAGQAAPNFNIVDVNGTPVALSNYAGKYVLVSFFRYAGCPFCNLTLIDLIERYKNFSDRGLQTVAFFQSDDESIAKYVAAKQPPFPVVADPQKVVYDMYKIESSKVGALKSLAAAPKTIAAIARGKVAQGALNGDSFLMPAQFVIGPDGTIVIAHYGTDFADKIPLLDIEETILTKVTRP
ncbi:AhpC/TSA family protein [Polaromonas sp.]|nr:AhpC/TSA family protein [Candidatus Saccharibacteria bacterium]